MKDNSVLSNNTAFLIRMKYSTNKIKYPARLHGGTLGIFTNLKRAESFLSVKEKKYYNFLEDKPFKIYEIEEIALNYFWNFVRTRFYDHNGQFYGEHNWEHGNFGDGNVESMNFDCRFKKGDVVEFIDGTILRSGIIAGVPPDKNTSPFRDYYIILHGLKEYSCQRVVSFNIFPLSAKISTQYSKRLLERFKKEYKKVSKLKKEIDKNSDNTTYRIIE